MFFIPILEKKHNKNHQQLWLGENKIPWHHQIPVTSSAISNTSAITSSSLINATSLMTLREMMLQQQQQLQPNQKNLVPNLPTTSNHHNNHLLRQSPPVITRPSGTIHAASTYGSKRDRYRSELTSGGCHETVRDKIMRQKLQQQQQQQQQRQENNREENRRRDDNQLKSGKAHKYLYTYRMNIIRVV